MEILHFRVCEDTGKLLMKIAIEKIIYNHTPEEAIKVFTESFGEDCPMEIIHKLIIGEYILEVDVENQMFGVETVRDEILHADYPKFDIKEYYIRQSEEILEYGNIIRVQIDKARTKTIKSDYRLDFDFNTIIEFCNGNKEALSDSLLDSYYDEDSDGNKVSGLMMLVKVIKDYISKTIQVQETLSWLRKTYPSYFIDEEKYIPRYGEYINILSQVSYKFSELLNGDYAKKIRIRNSSMNKELDKFITSQIQNDKILSKGIEPVNILDNYDAGWLAPNGDYYALNGHIANMLHLEIADALLSAGIISENYEEEALNKDAWLEQQGWVKIHGDNVQFAGCLNHNFNKKDVDITPIQIKKIYEYCSICHEGKIKLGWKQELMSASRFQMIAESNLQAMYDKYFEF
jgi:hypothetical protein